MKPRGILLPLHFQIPRHSQISGFRIGRILSMEFLQEVKIKLMVLKLIRLLMKHKYKIKYHKLFRIRRKMKRLSFKEL